ncbi:uncharacterized protein PFL1_05599 [Pseudozyma flocculosa PF-1]|uniref:J domain-containing protein n=2 Tax=Pseudozyma flocculosa TaxID=84751 RepID=A0A5C3F9N1_9BASI|nr:uncharacterized protein PFL1_05599 [Pseudozyma flocculosa PF-1]EPQ26964.1 hypothetical protein PFL1_05599 [Pseudozyma flocculosa PF-1]SPO41124.1 uncharacterized protein PSFLO_06606 [Pseudozyma flocculosa]
MFVASSLYRYATAKPEAPSESPQPNRTNRVKRRPAHAGRPLSPPPSYASVTGEKASGTETHHDDVDHLSDEMRAKIAVLDAITAEEDLYKVLNVHRSAKPEEIRRAFLNRSRICHPDKFPSYPASTIAFQKVALAYETLSKPSSRRMYDVSGRSDFAAAVNNAEDGVYGSDPGDFGDETLNNVLYTIMCEFLEGDFDKLKALIQAMNRGDNGVQVDSDAFLRKIHDKLLAGRRYLRVVHLELIRLYEIQQHLRSLSYLDVFGRLRLTIQLARVTLSIPMAIDQAMKTSGDGHEEGASGPGRDADADVDVHPPSGTESSDDDDEYDVDEDREQFFGIAVDDREAEVERVDRRAARRAARAKRRAREAARRQNLEAGHQRRRTTSTASASAPSPSPSSTEDAVQQRGLLGPATGKLLLNVIKVLEASESWVPGQSGRSHDPDQ